MLIVDDVISAGTSVGESVNLIRNSNAVPAGVLIALDRMEKGRGERSAVQETGDTYAMPVAAICKAFIVYPYRPSAVITLRTRSSSESRNFWPSS